MSLEFSVGPTVGRESELEQFDDALASLDATTSACIAVEGEPGIGKTHPARQRCATGRRSRAVSSFEARRRSSSARCRSASGPDAMDAYVASQELDLYEHWSAELVAELGEIVPSSRRASERSPRAVADERYRTYRAARELLELLAQDRPLVVVLDDLHWGDEASIELIATLLRRGADAPVLLALAFRPRQAPARLSAALATSPARRIALEPLTEEQATAFLADVDPGAAAAMYRHGRREPALSRAAQAGGRRRDTRSGSYRARRVRPGRGSRRAVRGRGLAGGRARVAPGDGARAAPCRGGRRGALRGRSRDIHRRARAVGRAPGAGRAARARPRPDDAGSAAVHVSPPSRTACCLRVCPGGLEARGPRARRPPSLPGGARRRASVRTTSSSTPVAAMRRRSR